MPDEPPRLFLSYGVRDASQIAERLCRDLMAGGYQVWQDVNRIRAGRPWDEEVQMGLRNSQVVLALLSPQSVRRSLDAGNPTATDSVCLDEIEYAQRACKIPIVPVQVVSCEAPFLIYRLHQINFRSWRESEATYQAGLNQICAAIAEAIQSRKSPERPWMPSLEPWDFAPFGCWGATEQKSSIRKWSEGNSLIFKSSGSFFRMLYLSATTITTLGLGDIVPVTDPARWAVGCEAVLGVILVGLF